MAGDEPRRPRGLKRSTQDATEAEKRARQEDEQAVAEQDEEAMELAMPDGEDLDDFEQAEAILQAALEFLADGDVARGRSLLQGAIHECDGLVVSKPDEAKARPFIYRVFGDALRELGLLLGQTDLIAAADRRYATALEIDAADVRTAILRARACVDEAAVRQSVEDGLRTSFEERVREAIVLLPDAVSAPEDRATAMALILALGHEALAAAENDDAPTEALVGLARHIFASLEKVDPGCAGAVAGQGACERTLAVSESGAADAARGAALLRRAIGMAGANTADGAQFTVWLAEHLLATDDDALDEVRRLLELARQVDKDLVSDDLLASVEQAAQ